MVKVKTAARFIWNISRMQLKPRRAPWHDSFCCLYTYKYEKSGTICWLFKRLHGKKKTLMKQDPNELHVAMENKSIKVGGVSAGEQLYDFVVGWCYLIYFYFGCAVLIHLEKVAVTAVSAYSGIHNWVTSLLSLTVTKRDKLWHVIVDITDLWDICDYQISDADERTTLYPGAFKPFGRGHRGAWGRRPGGHTLGMWAIFGCTSWICWSV